MKAALDLWLLLRRRTTSSADPHRLTGTLAVLAFAVTTAVVLVVIGGYLAFTARAAAPGAAPDDGMYVLFAGTASLLLLVPLVTLGGAAARLAVARRDARLAALRLAGATTAQVSAITILDATVQALTGAVIGAAGMFALVPLVLPIEFQDRAFSYGELLPPWWVYLATIGAVTAIALVSAGASLRKVAITPLGVAARTSPNPLHWSRVVPIVAFAALFAVLWNTGMAGLLTLALVVAGGFAMLNAIGPLVMSLVGRMAAKRARTAAQLVAARRILDAPKTAWRSVGGVALATFIAGMTSAVALFSTATGDAEQEQLFGDMATGGLLTLAIAGVVAAVSTGVMQAGGVIDRRTEYRALHLAGTDLRVLDRARLRETAVPLVAAVALATGGALVFLLPALGMTVVTSPAVLGQFALSVLGACALVLLGSVASRRVVRMVLA
ncbi:FtsX-like permease family protein [Ruania albidiflava]|uniref:FtsX-like permease family protein n=1 Tax=Ruania albidiflava TaxID=366586 RepID=UPI0003B6974A|nr:FtsX-like permease family protein [Ruania albidiflava]